MPYPYGHPQRTQTSSPDLDPDPGTASLAAGTTSSSLYRNTTAAMACTWIS